MKYPLKKYYQYLFCLLIFFLPLEGELRVVPNIILIILAVLYRFVIKKSDFIRCKGKVFLIFFTLILYILVNVITSGSLIDNLFILKKLGVIIAVYFLYLPLNVDKSIKISFILGVLVAVFISVFRILIYVVQTNNFNFSEGDIVTEILVTERIYLALMAVLSFVFSIDLIRNSTKRYKVILGFNISIVTLFILLVSARMALFSLIFIGIYNLIFLKKYKVLLMSFIVGSVILGLSFFLNQNLQNRFLYNNKESSFIENFKKWEPRVEIWSCIYDIFNENSFSEKLLGNRSFKKTNDELIDCYSISIEDLTKRKWFLKIKYNTHNQFFDFLVSMGLIGFLIFCSLLIISLYTNRKDRINFSLILAFAFIFLVENCFHRQIGVYLFAIVLIVISKNSESFNIKHGYIEKN